MTPALKEKSSTIPETSPNESQSASSRDTQHKNRIRKSRRRPAASVGNETNFISGQDDSADWTSGAAWESPRKRSPPARNNYVVKWVIGGVLAVVAVAAIAVVGIFAARLIQERTQDQRLERAEERTQERPVQQAQEQVPVFQTTNVRLKGQLELDDASIFYELHAGESELIFAFDRYRPMAKGVEQSNWDQNGVTRRNGRGELERFTALSGVPAITNTLNELGRPFCSVPITPAGHGQPRLLLSGSPGLFSTEKIYLTSVFIHSPFAANVNSWQVNRTWPETDGISVSGLLQYTKLEAGKSDHVTVAVEGSMQIADPKSGGGRTYSDLTCSVSGTQDYSLDLKQWTSASLVFKFAGHASDITGQFVVADVQTAKMKAQLADVQSTDVER